MSSNNYLTPYYYPPPVYNPGTTWNYNWPATNQTVSPRSAQTNSSIAPPPPPPPLPYSPTTSHTPAPVLPVSTASVAQRPQAYYNSNQSGAYRARRYNNTNTGQYGSSTGQYSMSSGQYPSNLQYSSTSGQYSTASGQYMINNPQGHSRNFYGKRKSESESDGMKKSNKKRKKPLSQNIPQRKDWSVYDAKRALMVEKEYNKKHKSQSLIIKFPDLELNRDIVSKFHSSIESVHFQQPSTPRFCFVTLNDVADPEVVIKALNKVKFGHGFLTAEFKKDREDEINLGPEDIDPLTLYVGNLAQEVTKDDMVNTYPKQRRIDIGYAKKMKYTRYAFVSFKNVDDSIEAFKKTHSTQMYSKSLIVRFRRLNGTVGMPGEPKPQMPQRIESAEHHSTGSPTRLSNEHNDVDQHPTSDVETEPSVISSTAPWEMVDVSNWETDTEKSVNFIKQETLDDSDDDDVESERKPAKRDYLSPFMPGSLEVAFSLHKPILKTEIKGEKPDEDNSVSSSGGDDSCDLSLSPTPAKLDKKHPRFVVAKDKISNVQQFQKSRDNTEAECSIIPPEKIKQENIKPDSGTTYNSLRFLQRKANSIDATRVEVKKETLTPTLDETSSDSKGKVSSADTEESIKVKSEPDNEDETNDDEEDDSSDESDDFNFTNILRSIEDRSRRLKKIKRSIM